MNVTNEQAECLILCGKFEWCEECPKYDEGCTLREQTAFTQEAMATDLLEARAYAKELREALLLALPYLADAGWTRHIDTDIKAVEKVLAKEIHGEQD